MAKRPEVLEDVEYHNVGDIDREADIADLEGEEDADGENDQPVVIRRLSEQKPKSKYRILKSHFFADQESSAKWRIQATEDMGFVAGEQLSREDKELLDAQQRPHIVFNRVLTIVNAIAGMEINGRHEVQFLPRNNDDTEKNEILTGASKWMADGCDAEDEQSQAFEDTVVTGMGWTESRFSYEDDPAGAYIEEQIDCREMYWDRTARKKNLKDARRMTRLRKMPLGDAMQLFPGKTRLQLDATWAVGYQGEGGDPKSIEEKRIRDGEDSYEEHDDKNEVTIVATQWWEREPYWLVADEQTNTKTELSEEEYEKLEERMAHISERLGVEIKLNAVMMHRKRYYQAFLGSEMLAFGDAPCGSQFSWACITGHFDKKKRQWYGLVRIVHDPQMWANKFMSQIMQIMNATAKGGILAETDAFDDEREAEDTYAMPEAITWVAKDALSGQRPKIIPKPGQGDAGAYVKLLEFAISSIKDVTGINPELLGQQDQNQPGILEHMRKQAGMTVLAKLFDSLRAYLKIIGRKRLYFIQTRMSDGRLIRIVGDDYAAAVPLAKEKTTGTYDVVVDDAPTSPNQKEANWAIIQPMLAAFKEQLMANPKVLALVLSYSPLPSALVAAIKKSIEEAAQNPDPMQKQMQDLALKKVVAEISKDQSIAEMNNAKAGTSQATAMYDVAMAKNLLTDNEREAMKHAQEMAKQDTHNITAVADLHKTAADTAHIQAKTVREQVGTRLDVQKNAHEIVKSRVAAHQAARQTQREDVQAHHTIQNERHGSALEQISAMAGAHRDMAAAHRDRVGAVVDARPEPRPVGA